MDPAYSITQRQLPELLLHVAVRRPVFVWGAPGIGKSSLVQDFARQVGLPCVSLLGTQLAPEDILGVPQIVDGTSRFCPPRTIARVEPYCLFLDELNACSHEVQKSFYSLILERRVGEYVMPAGSIVIGAGNRAQDSAIVKPMSSALLNRMVHVHLKVSHRDWLAWASTHDIHPLVIEYIQLRPDQLWVEPPKHEEPFSTPRSWHMLSDSLHEYGADVDEQLLGVLAGGCLTAAHAQQFRAFIKQLRGKYKLAGILKGDVRWPERPEDRDLLYFLAQSFRAHLVKALPPTRDALGSESKELAYRAKSLIKDLAAINVEMAQLVVSESTSGDGLAGWFMIDLARDLPRLVQARN